MPAGPAITSYRQANSQPRIAAEQRWSFAFTRTKIQPALSSTKVCYGTVITDAFDV